MWGVGMTSICLCLKGSHRMTLVSSDPDAKWLQRHDKETVWGFYALLQSIGAPLQAIDAALVALELSLKS